MNSINVLLYQILTKTIENSQDRVTDKQAQLMTELSRKFNEARLELHDHEPKASGFFLVIFYSHFLNFEM